MRYCRRCGLNSSMRGVSVTEDELCSVCKETPALSSEESAAAAARERAILREKFALKVAEARATGAAYDCAVSFSGGKDSSYVLYLMKHRYRMRVVAIGIAHPFVSPQARSNMENIAAKIGVDLLIFQPDANRVKEFFRKGLEVARSHLDENFGCQICAALYNNLVMRHAAKLGIPLLVTGRAPNQSGFAWREDEEIKAGIAAVREFWSASGVNLVESLSDRITSSLYNLWDVPEEKLPTVVDPLRFLDYDFREVPSLLEGFGVAKENQLGLFETNCTAVYLFTYLSSLWWDCVPHQRAIAHLLRSDDLDGEESFYNFAGQRLERDQIIPFFQEYRKAIAFVARDQVMDDAKIDRIRTEVPLLANFLGEDAFLKLLARMTEIHRHAAYLGVDI